MTTKTEEVKATPHICAALFAAVDAFKKYRDEVYLTQSDPDAPPHVELHKLAADIVSEASRVLLDAPIELGSAIDPLVELGKLLSSLFDVDPTSNYGQIRAAEYQPSNQYWSLIEAAERVIDSIRPENIKRQSMESMEELLATRHDVAPISNQQISLMTGYDLGTIEQERRKLGSSGKVAADPGDYPIFEKMRVEKVTADAGRLVDGAVGLQMIAKVLRSRRICH